jgi:SAM-dependent methyltransferase
MPAGPLIRRAFGPFEHAITEAYRRIFVDLNDFVELMSEWVPAPKRILEVGCGEGAVTERLVRTYPRAAITGIDISPNVGRLFRGPASAVRFAQETAENLADREPESFDLIVLADVMHHVPEDGRKRLVKAIHKAMAPTSSFVFKEWVVSWTPMHWCCGSSDRFLSGDGNVSYLSLDGMKSLLTDSFEPAAIRATGTIRPWHNNVAVLVQLPAPARKSE